MTQHIGQKIPSLDGVRGLAVLLVVLSHFLVVPDLGDAPIWQFFRFGWSGVELFFVLSGFLITGILLDSKSNNRYFSNFYIRRSLRIFPLYYFCLAICWILVYVVENQPDRLQGYDSLGWYVAFCSNIAVALKGDWTFQSDWITMGHFWSLAVEEQFYLIWPLLVYILSGRQLIVVSAAIWLLGPFSKSAVQSYFDGNEIAPYVLLPGRMDALAAGAFLAAFLREAPPYLVRLPDLIKWPIAAATVYWGYTELDQLNPKHFYGFNLWLLAAFVLFPYRIWTARAFVVSNFAFLYWTTRTHNEGFKFSIIVALFFGSVYLAMHDRFVRRFFENGFLVHLGKYSYATYLFHHFFTPVWQYAFGNALIHSSLPPWLAQVSYFSLAGTATYLCARASWALLEKPFLDLKDKWAPK